MKKLCFLGAFAMLTMTVNAQPKVKKTPKATTTKARVRSNDSIPLPPPPPPIERRAKKSNSVKFTPPKIIKDSL